MSCRCLKKIEFYYTHESLIKNEISCTDNWITYLCKGIIYKDKSQKNKLGEIFIEETVDKNSGLTKSVVNVLLNDGNITYVVFHNHCNCIDLLHNEVIGPVTYGTKKYLTWNSSNYYSKIINYENNRHVIIYKN
jgi:hypothetical protein